MAANDFWANLQGGLGRNSNALIGLGSGLLAGDDFAHGLAMGGSGWRGGSEQDAVVAKQKKTEDDRLQQINQTAAFLRSKGAEDLAAAVEGNMTTGSDAFGQWYSQAHPKPAEAFTLGAGDTRYGADGSVIAQGAPDQQDQFGNEKDLFAQYAGSDPVKAYETVKSGYERVRQSSALQTGAGDMGLIYGYMKMLDPGSVVRESEFAQAAQAGSYGEQIQGWVSRIINGERLPDSVRGQFVQAADGIYKDTAANLGDINSQFSTRASRYGVDPSTFVRQPEAYQPTQGIVTMPNGNTVRPM